MGLCASKPCQTHGGTHVLSDDSDTSLVLSKQQPDPATREAHGDPNAWAGRPVMRPAGRPADPFPSSTFPDKGKSCPSDKTCQDSLSMDDAGLLSLDHKSSQDGSMPTDRMLKSLSDIPLVMFNPQALEAGRQGLPHDVATYGAPRAPNEEDRMATIKALRHMGADSCPELDYLLRVVCSIWDAANSSVTLLDSEHVWMCNAVGPGAERCHKPWAVAMCPWTLLTPNPTALAVGDLEQDARFNGNVHNTSGVSSYLTAPLVASNGHRLGAICFVDGKTRKFNAGDARLMNNFAELAVREIEKHVNLAERLKESEESELAAVYRQRVRDVDEIADTCVMLVDTSAPGWRLLYVSPTWEEWTGVDREECTGRSLSELLEYVHGNKEEPVIWQGLERDARELKPFVTPKVCVKPSFGKVGPLHHSFYLSFKAASVDPLDCATVPVGVPASLPMTQEPTISRYYFARLHTVPNPPPNSRVTFGLNGRTSSSHSPHHSARQDVLLPAASQLEAMSPAVAAASMFKGLTASHVLGQGAFGTVWYATWHATSVALKVISTEVTCVEDLQQVKMEQQVGSQLMHVNVVRTLACASSVSGACSRANAAHLCNSEGVTSAASWEGTEDAVSLVPLIGGDARWAPMQPDAVGPRSLKDTTTGLAAPALSPAQAATPCWPMPSVAVGQHTSSTHSALLHVVPQTLGEATGLSGGGQPSGLDSPLASCIVAERSQPQLELPTYMGPTWHAVGMLDTCSKGWEQTLEHAAAAADAMRTYPQAVGAGEEEETRLRRYSSGGLLGKWRRSTEATVMQLHDETAFPYTFRQWVVLEFCDRGCLCDAIDRGDMRLSRIHSAGPALATVVCNALDIARGLAYMHSKGVVHGDLTAVNVLLQSCSSTNLAPGDPRDYQAKLSDFGMSHVLDARDSVVAAGYGTMTHMAPEVLTERRISAKGDVYSLGVIVHQMVTGSRPWAGLSHLQVVVAVGHEHRQLQWAAQPPGSPLERLSQLGRSCLDPDPDKRPNAQEAVNALEELAGLLAAAATTSSTSHASNSSLHRVWVLAGTGEPPRPLD